ncbi:MAG: hypothetical protein QOI24_1265 [Acidobacteriota bacterium]|nr:hypothetical protein [Acidobacteriota bacterium]
MPVLDPIPADLDARIERLLRGDGRELDAFLTVVERDVMVPDTKATIHCNVVSLDGNLMPRVKDLARSLALSVVEYAIPRREIEEADAADRKNNNKRRTTELVIKARQLFTSLDRTGEGGELLLYMFAQSQLKLPQVFCKMALKTNRQMHVHGIDGIHAGYDADSGQLALYWGESKLHKTIASAVTECLDSIKPYVCGEGGTGAAYERDLQLMRDNIDLADPALEAAILTFLDRDHPLYNKVQFRGVCLVGFDETLYPKVHNEKELDALVSEARVALQKWVEMIGGHITKRPPLASIHLEVFLLPFPSVEYFRKAFLHEIGHG